MNSNANVELSIKTLKRKGFALYTAKVYQYLIKKKE